MLHPMHFFLLSSKAESCMLCSSIYAFYMMATSYVLNMIITICYFLALVHGREPVGSAGMNSQMVKFSFEIELIGFTPVNTEGLKTFSDDLIINIQGSL